WQPLEHRLRERCAARNRTVLKVHVREACPGKECVCRKRDVTKVSLGFKRRTKYRFFLEACAPERSSLIEARILEHYAHTEVGLNEASFPAKRDVRKSRPILERCPNEDCVADEEDITQI